MEQILDSYFPFWNKLSDREKRSIGKATINKKFKKGNVLYSEGRSCTGIEIVKSGRVRVFIMSPNGGEITLYRLLDGDICVLSAACMINSLDVEINMEFEEDSEIYLIPKNTYKELSDNNNIVKEYTLELISNRFSDVMWILKQIVFTGMANRLATALIDHSALEQSNILHITHEKLAKDLGTAREVISRLLKQFEVDNIVSLSRGVITITDTKKLKSI
ncbi:Crp/Fnr family transcriptional regulator [Sedimentibacter sp. zth1]|uniref:Crp/Fnr family transcriptional regulator n=1 Tax=Sedimentibacter sp. zth1 TaxID=2816908 RepID=UPI001A90F1D7|nr:Crp/Fnr family transcriptional regulator [Sedimentibacter sp. zth1]QSX06494.1 Crp/Fnr family transcriptional regulator [Sedimentibacter sp. zth1]